MTVVHSRAEYYTAQRAAAPRLEAPSLLSQRLGQPHLGLAIDLKLHIVCQQIQQGKAATALGDAQWQVASPLAPSGAPYP